MKDFELIYASQLRAKQRESRALVIDIRDRKEYEREHWPGAVSYRMLGEQGYHVASVVGGYEAMKKISKNYFKNRENM